MYPLPARSTTKFSHKDVLELRERFTVNGCTYARFSDDTVALTYADGSDTIVLPEWITFNGETYYITTIYAMNDNGFYNYNKYATSNKVKTLISIGSEVTYYGCATDNPYLKNIIVVKQ